MPDGKRLWRTADGDLVEDGHPDAVLLAYGSADELTGDDVEKARKPKPEKVEDAVTPKSTGRRPKPKS